MTDLRETLADIHHHLTEIRRDLQPALNSLAGRATTGFPTHTGAGHTSGGDTADPTLTAIANADRRDHNHPDRHWSSTAPHPDRARLNHAIHEAERHLATARGIIHRHTPPGEATPDEGTPGCTSCARIGQHADRYRGDLCTWCYRYRTCHHPGQKADMPARELVAIFHTKGKVTPTDFRDLKLPLPGQTEKSVAKRPCHQ